MYYGTRSSLPQTNYKLPHLPAFSRFPRPYIRLTEFTTEYVMKESVFIKAILINFSFMIDGVIFSAVVWLVDFNATSDRT